MRAWLADAAFAAELIHYGLSLRASELSSVSCRAIFRAANPTNALTVPRIESTTRRSPRQRRHRLACEVRRFVGMELRL